MRQRGGNVVMEIYKLLLSYELIVIITNQSQKLV